MGASAHPALTEKLNTFARVIRHDMRGTGLSDRYAGLPDLETEARDIIAVLDAAGSRSTVIVSAGNVVLPSWLRRIPDASGRSASSIRRPVDPVAPGYPWGRRTRRRRPTSGPHAKAGEPTHMLPSSLEAVASLSGDRELIRWYARLQRHWVAPGDAVELLRRSYETDIRDVLPSIGVPTLCIVREFEGTEAAEYIARTIQGDARDPAGFGALLGCREQDALVAAIRDFIGVAPSSGVVSGRALRAVLFTDIVGSTETAFRLGVDEWKALLERHHELVQPSSRRSTAPRSTPRATASTPFEGPAAAVRCAEAISKKVKASASRSARACTSAVRGDRRPPRRTDRRDRRPGRRAGGTFGGPRLADRERPRRGFGDHVRRRRGTRAQGRARSLAPLPGGGMIEVPETRYTKTADGVYIAYQVAGEGPLDLVVMASALGLGNLWTSRHAWNFPRRFTSSAD